MPPSPAARFEDPVELYDLCHGWIDHAAHGARIAAWLRELGVPKGGRVVEGACGSGLWLAALGEGWAKAGFDLDGASLRRAAGRNPGAQFFTADLADWRVEAPADAVLLLFGALAYVPDDRLDAACQRAAEALAPGGVVVVEPWVEPDDFRPGEPQMVVLDTPWLKVCRQVLPRREGSAAVLEFHHLVTAPGLAPRLVRATDRLWLREEAALHAALERAGLRQVGSLDGTMPGRQLTAWRPAS